jgi:hypothetical protein
MQQMKTLMIRVLIIMKQLNMMLQNIMLQIEQIKITKDIVSDLYISLKLNQNK